MSELEAQMRSPIKSHIKHRYVEMDAKGASTCKFVCHTFWASQFEAVRRAHFGLDVSAPECDGDDVEEGFVRSLCSASKWDAKGGKSGATFSKTSDARFVVKYVTRTELQMFLDCALHYFEYLAKAFFHKLPTVLCKIMGVYQIGYHNKATGKRYMDQVVVMQNLFHGRNIARVFDLKGSTRSRYVTVAPCAPPAGGGAEGVSLSVSFLRE
ncbi:hypothetical protein JKP88DRAFT_175957 [Tribonema minus]|uniref:PIPK domain-containing protein n=1 Tax=Tribonema minus TaxID=303371 RepID=A0A835ZAJ6_9STRA|nr:hypothetical protein JKP88DRAFT_175957 [Tribonema minus]